MNNLKCTGALHFFLLKIHGKHTIDPTSCGVGIVVCGPYSCGPQRDGGGEVVGKSLSVDTTCVSSSR